MIASCTRRSVSGVTPGSPFTTRETVFRPTPARAATSFIVGRAPYRGEGLRAGWALLDTGARPYQGPVRGEVEHRA
ncbi:hypothetical protein GCM10010324_09970 [Streptomyces hiroshimensis]|uniref:Uncharacterized protein n=1 Tax=Streptomyces hiroshimensis TaxID=66424 RepID=A0ABQ2Y6I1_9ACTN|nr:hypothetical protein GCM10010324_09970 [Streptomyces hiroshimensis]